MNARPFHRLPARLYEVFIAPAASWGGRVPVRVQDEDEEEDQDKDGDEEGERKLSQHTLRLLSAIPEPPFNEQLISS